MANKSESIRMPIEILLVVDDEASVRTLEEQLTEVAPFQFIIEYASNHKEAAERLRSKSFDLILLDVTTDDGTGMEVFRAIKDQAAEVPIVVVASLDDEKVAELAVAAGAQEYIVKGHVNSKYLASALRHAVARERLRKRLVDDAHLDELTGLLNRRGFVSLGQQQITMADRTKRGLMLFFIDLDGMKKINDTYGHQTGDQALVDSAEVFRKSFRRSDILSRIGGDEFAILAIETMQKGREVVRKRLNEQVAAFNALGQRPYQLSLSIGVVVYDSTNPCTIQELLDQADRLMYERKKQKGVARLLDGGISDVLS
jgi:diguanylate cyclase (GGDEF)-like protein